MKTTKHFIALTACAFALALNVSGQVPGVITYQGRVTANGTNFTGSGQFKFVLRNALNGQSLWSNDGTSINSSQPAAQVTVNVADGLFTVNLGDTTLPNMQAIPAAVFANSDVRLRLWFNDGVNGFAPLSPDQRITSVGYAMMSANVPDGLITAGKLAPGVLSPTNFPANSVSSTQLGDSISLGASNVFGRLDVYRTSAGTPAVSLFGSGSQISTYGSDGLEQIRLWGAGYGELLLNNSLANNATAVRLTANGSTGGELLLNNTNGSNRALLEGENTGGRLTLYQADGNVGAVVYGSDSGSGALSLRDTNGNPRLRAYGGPNSGTFELYDASGTRTFWAQGAEGTTAGSQLNMYQANGARTIQLDAEVGANGGGYFGLYEADGTETVVATANGAGNVTVRQGDGSNGVGIYGNNGTGGGGVTVYRDSGTFAAQLTVSDVTDRDGYLGLANSSGNTRLYARGSSPGGSQGGYLGLMNSAGSQTITLDAGTGTATAQVIQITGGSDLSENFNINAAAPEPGLIVSLDPQNPGELVLSAQAYDTKVAGIISGAGGVLPGMVMGQRGSVADGKYPVALTGRVYCWMDAGAGGAIGVGDLITTSSTPGHGMKASDHGRRPGAIIGKAMTSLAKGKGLVLVLVSLQ